MGARLRYTPITDLLRGRITGRLDWRGYVETAELTPELKQVVIEVVSGTRLRRSQQVDIAIDLITHFEIGLASGIGSSELIQDFGDPALTARMMRSAQIRIHRVSWIIFRVATLLVTALIAAYLFLSLYFYWGAEQRVGEKLAPVYHAVPSPPGLMDRILLEAQPGKPLLPLLAELEHLPTDPAQCQRWMDSQRAMIAPLRWACHKELSQLAPAVLPAANPSAPEPYIVRLVASAFALDANRALELNQTDCFCADIDALVDLSTLLHSSHEFHGNTRYALLPLKLAYEQIDAALNRMRAALRDDDLRHLAQRIAGPEVAGDLIDLRAEHDAVRKLLDQSYTGDAQRSEGRLTPGGWNRLREDVVQSPLVIHQLMVQPVMEALFKPVSIFSTASRWELDREFQQMFTNGQQILSAPLRDANLNAGLQQCPCSIATNGCLIYDASVAGALPAAVQAKAQAAERTLGRRDGVLVGLALEKYRRQKGTYPARLDQLVPGEIAQLPVDRITGDPLHYRLVDGTPLVYSVGMDRLDDGGLVPSPRGIPDLEAAATWDPDAPVVHGDWILYRAAKQPD
jgi:hypothetical protein